MRDMEHEEWIENAKTRKAAKKTTKKPAIPPKKSEDKKSGNEGEEFLTRSWVID